MAEKKKGKQRKTEEEKPTKEEYAVAKYLRFNMPTREGKLHGMEVKCFHGSSAVEKLMNSKWSATKNKKNPLFTNRNSCVTFMLRLLEMGLFHRAEKEHRKRDKDKPKRKKKEKEEEKEKEKDDSAPIEEELKERKVKRHKKSKKAKVKESQSEKSSESKVLHKKDEKKDDKKKKEKRLKLVMPEQQFFEDSDEIYVWIYDPVNAKTFMIGLLMVLGAIALCMFPLWPEEVRIGVYYLSICLAGFVGFILSLVVVRLILFCFIWTLTLGKHHFWLLPNLTEDVGFFDSFRPLYKHEAVSRGSEAKLEPDKVKKNDNDEENQAVEEKVNDKDDFELIKTEDLEQTEPKPEDVDEEDDDEEDDDEVDANENNNDEEPEYDEERDDEEDSSELSKDQLDEKKKTK